MQIIPVMDLRGGLAVHAKAGDRANYLPVELIDGTPGDAKGLAAIYQKRHPPAIYIADLNAISGEPAQTPLWRQIAEVVTCPLWIDAGVRNSTSLAPCFEFLEDHPEAHQLVLGTETVTSEHELESIAGKIPPRQCILSLDRKQGKPLGALGGLSREQGFLMAAQRAGVRQVIALDLAAVGVGQPSDYFEAWRSLLDQFPEFQWFLGGGIRHREDLETARQHGFHGVLAATAILRGDL